MCQCPFFASCPLCNFGAPPLPLSPPCCSGEASSTPATTRSWRIFRRVGLLGLFLVAKWLRHLEPHPTPKIWQRRSKPMGSHVWGFRCTTYFRTYFSGDWDVHWGYELDFCPWPSGRGCQSVQFLFRALRSHGTVMTQRS